MANVRRMTRNEILVAINNTFDDELIDELYEELERRQHALDLFDWSEQDRRSASEELFERHYQEQ